MRIRFRRERITCRLPRLILGFSDDRRGMIRGRDVSLTILIGRQQKTYLFRLRLAFDAAKEIENLTAFSARKVNRVAAEEIEECSSVEGQ